ncbi:bile acid:sodium symporter family protein [Corynebacterium glutamicum]|uniref:bile acid:sodium symporter family protein n=1 Tax=Corynebacterium TaxID=1716 RepID=UPI0008063B06|nr:MULTISPECIES: bile acid:sodium symporter family protein [Corynebacterium]ANR62317.1 Na+-dependent transporter [[Brevibacterium] flavum ZL-1]ANR65322.1 Na+-dependent transporter [Corynebacterium glutamicum ZL-6]ANU33469.1 Bile acid:sodium symporter [Corynebacterium glutamicum]PST76280.1 Na+-dependent transporter [Corynebacterium glutamicum ZL-2]QWQ84134.1 Bile acid:sodium symporter [Corynebacterium glutamicum]
MSTQVELKTPKSEDRAAYIAALGFPVLVIIGGIIGFTASDVVLNISSWVNPLLGIIMFSMGLTLKPVDFALVAKRPLPVLIGVIAQFVIMPLIALLVVWVLQLPAEIAAGVILVGCAPGGTSSNVVSYLSRGDVALSVTMTSISTLLAPIFTPLLTLWLAGQYMPLNAADMAVSIVQVVLIPVVGGLVVRLIFPTLIGKVLPLLPWISVIAISLIVAIVVAGSRDKILEAGLLVLAAVIIHNTLGYSLGYLAAKFTGQPAAARRTTAIEVGMQNSGLAAGLASQYMSPMSALPGAIFSVWHNLSGALLAALCRASDKRAAEKVASEKAASEKDAS